MTVANHRRKTKKSFVSVLRSIQISRNVLSPSWLSRELSESAWEHDRPHIFAACCVSRSAFTKRLSFGFKVRSIHFGTRLSDRTRDRNTTATQAFGR